MTEFLLIRHGETEWARQGLIQGQRDTPLTPLGRAQAQRLRERLSPHPIEAIYSSDLRRCLDTALILAGGEGGMVHPTPRLRELHFGQAQGLTFDQIQHRFPQVAELWLARSPQLAFPGGEGMGELFGRTSAFFGEVLKKHPSGRVGVVAHDGPLRWALCLLLGWEQQRWWELQLSLASLSIIEAGSPSYRLVLLNDTSHLGGL